MTIDRDRAQVYAAEAMAYEGTDLEEITRFEAVVACITAVVDDPWWPGGDVRVSRARSDARSSSARSAVGRPLIEPPSVMANAATPRAIVAEIRLAAGQFTLATGMHELGHALAGPAAGHGERFRRAHTDVAAVAFGVERAGWLVEAYERAGLPLGERAWPEPPTWATGGAIAL